MGSLSSVGIGSDSHYQALLAGTNGIETLPEWAEEYPCKVRKPTVKPVTIVLCRVYTTNEPRETDRMDRPRVNRLSVNRPRVNRPRVNGPRKMARVKPIGTE